MRRWPLASARCSLIRRFFYSEPLMAALYREMGRFDDAIALYKSRKTSVVECPLVLRLPTRR